MKKIWFILLYTLTLPADQFSFMFYNDTFARTDQHFTNGLSFSWLDNSIERKDDIELTGYSVLVLNLVDTISFGSLDMSQKHTAGLGLSQITITPEDLTQSTPQYDDAPYAGYLALSFYLLNGIILFLKSTVWKQVL